jgi:hypothetical protein
MLVIVAQSWQLEPSYYSTRVSRLLRNIKHLNLSNTRQTSLLTGFDARWQLVHLLHQLEVIQS